jgi:hypothetical protein
MGQLLHGNARTTEAVRCAILHGHRNIPEKEQTDAAASHGVSPETCVWSLAGGVPLPRPERAGTGGAPKEAAPGRSRSSLAIPERRGSARGRGVDAFVPELGAWLRTARRRSEGQPRAEP